MSNTKMSKIAKAVLAWTLGTSVVVGFAPATPIDIAEAGPPTYVASY